MVSDYSQYAWLIPLFPLIAFLALTAMGRQLKDLGIYISIAAMLASFIVALLIFVERLGGNVEDYTWDKLNWLQVGDFTLNMGFEVNNLNALMLVIVTLVSLLVNVYSKGYMKGDERIHVFFGYIALFSFSMLGLVISENMLMLYIFWELVGVCSFLLVGFWYFKPEAKAAAKKAFIVTRIGDVGLFLAILLLYWYMPGHALDFTSIHNAFTTGKIDPTIVTWIAVLIFVGAIGKSGQFPLHTWLPDAMEGPTPISALIHAATMVAAGVYLVARTFDIFQASPDALLVVAYVGGFTAIFAATIGIAQNDIKRILAYSTVSQLGYMMMALGIGVSYTSGMFHLFTHAFFKALLFLGAGSVIHAVHTQDINEMGGLSRKMKITTWTFAIGTLALAGIFPFAGFWSKDMILTEAYEHNQLLFWIGVIAAFFTAFYMSRLFFLVFMGSPKHNGHGHEPHESPASMTTPLIVLAVLAVVAGFVNTPFNEWLGHWLTGQEHDEKANWMVIILSTLAGLLGIGLGYLIYLKRSIPRDVVSSKAPWLYTLLNRKYFIDEIYGGVFVRPLRGLGLVLELIDIYIIDGIVRLVAFTVVSLGRLGSRLQNGQLQTYGVIMIVGMLILVLAIAGRRFIHAG
ncbi:NADH-quinone oxidoreductase subunit L [Paenibacillus sp. GCM10023248]|uniref:NADH-quinone oxidoreductase subunit L n=1 Tax=Bacillales TaxID=1385 RepID=UPI002377DB6A|nr:MULTISPECIES: NADH-quinone oxidoreductase subunit L [Bacillales]MDD9271956.1 NADH-quinone oxidoreductase subunit L [Paenibacillus sp. MAHUQ-63]MDR6883522.1 NADH-quinone oxidoreductase subunit L [Bacillus sp. 3255]